VYGWSAAKRSCRFDSTAGSDMCHSEHMSCSADGLAVWSVSCRARSTATVTPSSVSTSSSERPTCRVTRPRTHTRSLSGTHTSVASATAGASAALGGFGESGCRSVFGDGPSPLSLLFQNMGLR